MRVPFWASLAWSLGLACGEGLGPEDWPEGVPRIDAIEFLQQEPTEPSNLQFLLEFVDSDGDVSQGQADLYLQGQMTSSLPAQQLFLQQSPPLDLEATSGHLLLDVRLLQELLPGQQVQVGFELVDGAGNRSNRPSVLLQAVGEGLGS